MANNLLALSGNDVSFRLLTILAVIDYTTQRLKQAVRPLRNPIHAKKDIILAVSSLQRRDWLAQEVADLSKLRAFLDEPKVPDLDLTTLIMNNNVSLIAGDDDISDPLDARINGLYAGFGIKIPYFDL
jgi:hypothetical protein